MFWKKTTLNVLVCASNNHHCSHPICDQICNHLHQIKNQKVYHPYLLGMGYEPILSYPLNPNHND